MTRPTPPTKRYGILDEEGAVIRWQRDKPSDQYDYIVQRIPRQPREPKIDWSRVEPAPF